MKVAVVGCGNISRLHFAAADANPLTDLVAAVDIKGDRARAYAEKYGINAYTDYDEMLEKEHPDIVHICTPHYLHTPYAIKALEKGINVFCEKPCSVSDDEVEQLRNAQEKSGAHFGVCFQNRYNKCIQYIKNAQSAGKTGRLLGIRAFVTWNRGEKYYSDDWHGTREKECGCLLINQAIHTLDLIEYIGGNISALTAHVSNDHLQGIIEGEDTASILFDLENGAKAVFYGTTAYGTDAPVIIEAAFENATYRTEGEKLYETTDGVIKEIPLETLQAGGKQYWGSGHPAIINDFYSSISEGRPFATDAFSGGKAAKTVFAAYRSSDTNSKITF